MEVLRVSSGTDFRRLAAALALSLRKDRRAVLRAAGPGACYAAVKAVLAARGLTAPEGSDLRFAPRIDRRDGVRVLELEIFWR